MTLLLLAGTGEARRIAAALKGRDAVASLAGATREAAPLDLPVREGGFGGAAGFEAFLDEAGIEAVLDATHPFAHRITRRSAEICAARGLPYLQFLRPPWQPGPGDRWTEITREEDAARHMPEGATVFLGTGRQRLERFANLEGRRVICRRIDPPEGAFPFPGGDYLLGRPPFSAADEEALFRRLDIDVLVVKNAGGAASATKLAAARALGLPVLMLRRPDPGPWPVTQDVEEAIRWAQAHTAND